MRIHLLIADDDQDYGEHLSRVLVERYADMFEVSSCSNAGQLAEILSHHKYDAALLSPELAKDVNLQGIRIPLLLWDGTSVEQKEGMDSLRKYQRVSTIAGEVLERFAEIASFGIAPSYSKAQITVVWSPAGGVGKTTAALAYAAQKVSKGQRSVYLDLEPFSSLPAFFTENGKSISTIFEKLDERAELALQSIRQEDSGSGIYYFCRPDNYEDISILTEEDIVRLAGAAAVEADELIIDLGAGYDRRIAALLNLADTVLFVIDGSKLCQTKWEQFQTQHELHEKLRERGILVVNRGGRYHASQTMPIVNLPLVKSDDPSVVYKTLSAGYFPER
ncbi:MAG: hypothetical protein HFF83_08485 [Oscillibacter sp.]|jgi:Mrp family chromosome partitioning ATPase|nr:hypothetical protein [Oscillibacter sp.]